MVGKTTNASSYSFRVTLGEERLRTKVSTGVTVRRGTHTQILSNTIRRRLAI
jgi:hypothetical protein